MQQDNTVKTVGRTESMQTGQQVLSRQTREEPVFILSMTQML